MSETDLAYHYLKRLHELPKPAKPELQASFCRDFEVAGSLIHNLKTIGLTPTLEVFALLAQLEFLLAKNNLSAFVESYQQAKVNVSAIRQKFIEENPDLADQLKFQKNNFGELDEQIAHKTYVADPTDRKSRNRYTYIRNAAINAKTTEASLQAQARFRQIHANYSKK